MSAVGDALAPFLEASALVHALDVGPDGIVSQANAAAAVRLKLEPGALVGRSLASLVVGDDSAAAAALLAGPGDSAMLHFVTSENISFPLAVQAIRHEHGVLLLGEPPALPFLRLGDDLSGFANELAVESRERARRARRLTGELAAHEESYWHLTRDQEVLPICMGCGRVQTADGSWETLAAFMQRATDFLSHGYCETCALELRAM